MGQIKVWLVIAAMVALTVAGFLWVPSFSSYLTMLALISLLVIAHELGHFSVAKWCGVRVDRFGFGLPIGPTLLEKQVGETTLCLHPVLLGGYVSFPDDNPESDLPEDSPRRFENQPWLHRVAIILAGVTVNALMAYILMFLVIGIWGMPGTYALIEKIENAKTPAAVAGLKPGDLILAINGEPTITPTKRADSIITTFQASKLKPADLTIQRNGETIHVTVTPNSEGRIGIGLIETFQYMPVKSPVDIVSKSVLFLHESMAKQFEVFGQILTGKTSLKAAGAAGPVGIVKQGGILINKFGLAMGLMISALISMTLAIMNVLPIPMLDGGHFLFMVIEKLKGSPIKKEIQERVIQFSFYLLMGLMVVILWNDVNVHLLGH